MKWHYIVWFGKVRPKQKGHSMLTVDPLHQVCRYH